MDYRTLLPFLPIVVLPLGFVAVGVLLSVVSGWRAHASRHPDRETTGTRLRGVSGMVGWVNFNHVLTLDLDARGIRFSVFKLFPGFRPFHLAWSDIASLDVVPGFFRRRLDIVPKEGSRIRVFGAAVDAVVAASQPGARFDEVRSSESSGLPVVLVVGVAIVIVAAAVAAFVTGSP